MIRKLNWTDITKIYNSMMPEAFPADEIRPYDSIKTLYTKKRYMAFGEKKANGEILGYAMFYFHEGNCLLDYLSVAPAQRNKGLGGTILDDSLIWLDNFKMILLEVESPDTTTDESEKALRSRRMAFYQRHGIQLSGVRSKVFGVDYKIMYFSKTKVADDIIRDKIGKLYLNMVSPELYRGNFIVYPD